MNFNGNEDLFSSFVIDNYRTPAGRSFRSALAKMQFYGSRFD